MSKGFAWSARCDCYSGHSSNSGRCHNRSSSQEEYETYGVKFGVIDPTRNEGEASYCQTCRETCRKEHVR